MGGSVRVDIGHDRLLSLFGRRYDCQFQGNMDRSHGLAEVAQAEAWRVTLNDARAGDGAGSPAMTVTIVLARW
jgi:hypothetical protein